MTNIDEFNIDDCKKIDPNCINAYVDFHLDPDNPTGICLDTSWGGDCLDLSDIVKTAETCTSLYLSPEEDPNCLVYEGECETFCITGDELSRIISMTKLKDVDQDTAPVNGDVYIYRDGKFYTFNLQEFIGNTGTYITNLQNSVNNLQTRVTNIENSIRPIVNRFEEFTNVPANAKIMLGNINLYSDTNAVVNGSGTATSLDKSHGIYGHALNQDKAQDELFG
jgi:hypothetical protein